MTEQHLHPSAWVSPLAAVGNPPEHRDHRREHWGLDQAFGPYYPVIHADVIVEAFVTIDTGTYRATEIGARSYLMKRTHIAHDVVVGEDCEFAVGTTIAGSVTVGDRVRVGVNACVIPFRKIGDGARIGAGAVVVSNVPANTCVAGNPARFMHTLCRVCGAKVGHAGFLCPEHDNR